jgi:hypothetical protein
VQPTPAPADARPSQDLTIPPCHGRAGRGAASIVPHLDRQQQINDKPPSEPSQQEEVARLIG